MDLLLPIINVALVWFLVVTIPGPNFVVVTRGAASGSRKAGLWLALGVSTGAGVWAAAGLLGLSLLFKHAAWLHETIRMVGGIYLVYMGGRIIWSAVFQAGRYTPVERKVDAGSPFFKGLFTSFSNPKTATFFSSLFVAAFPAQAPFWAYLLTVALVIAISLIWYTGAAWLFSLVKVQTVYQRLRRGMDIFSGSILSLLGIRLIFDQD